MSVDDYAQHIIRKHQLAIALAIIKTKPADITYEAYINIIKNKINERNMDSNLDITICDDDFNISDDFTQYDDQMINGDDQMINGDDQIIKGDDRIINGDVHMTVGDDLNNSHDSVNILKNFELADLDDPYKQNSDVNSLLDVMTELSNIEDNSEAVVNNPQINFNKTKDFEETQIPLNFIRNKSYGINDNVRNFCHTYMPSNDKVDNKHITEDNNSTNHTICNNNSIPDYATDLNENLSNITYCESNNCTDRNKENDNTVYNNITFKYRTNKINIENNNIDSQQTILYTLQGFTNNTHVSQSQEENPVILNKHLLNISKTDFNKNSSIQNLSEVSQNKKDELIDIDLNKTTRNRYSEEDFAKFCANKIEILNKNTNETENMYFSQDYEQFDANKANVLDRITIFSDDDVQRKHKNVECDSHYNSKRAKIDEKENNSIDSSSRIKSTELSQNFNNATKSSEIPSDLNTGHDLTIFSKNNEIEFDKSFNRNTEQAEINTNKDYLTQDFAFLDSYSNKRNTSQSKLNGDTLDNQFSPVSQSLPSPNTHGNTSFKTAFNVIVKRSKNNNNYNTDCNTITKDVIEKKNTQNLNSIRENSINVDEPFINLSQNVRYVGNNKTKKAIFESKRKEYVSNIDGTDPEALLKESSNKNIETQEQFSNLKTNQQLKQNILNNLANDDAIKEVILHQKNMKEGFSQDITQIDIVTHNDLSDDSEMDTQSEIVPFKVLEDLNRIKCYLNRSEKRLSQGFNSLDSGFESSQPRSSYKSASQYSEVWKNESAHCLLSFVTVSQLSDKTAAIADEISRILGQLVDKLHEEEKYPNFLEELLEKVATLLKDVYEGNNAESNALLKRDDAIYRLLLLNRSAHIIKYTIEKITTILEKTLSDLKEDVFELKNIDKTENLCYMFHILEVILKRHKKTNVSSQMSVQNSQDDDRLLKKSSLTDIWRKKWNLAKSENIEGSSKKTCVLTKCSEVLNKLIVQAMDGYSLVSFAALQCFNLLQN